MADIQKEGRSIHDALWKNLSPVSRGISEGWLKDSFQKGMRNADGSPRRAKYSVRLDLIPQELFLV
jgi:hypothetical protein